MRPSHRLLALCALAALLAALAPAGAQAYGLKDLSVSFARDAEGTPATQAGSHPYTMTTTLAVATETFSGEEEGEPAEFEVPSGETEDLTVSLPPGFVGDPTAVPRCSGADFATIDKAASQPACASETAIGLVGIRAEFGPINPHKEGFEPGTYKYTPVYNLVPPPGVAAQFGFLVFNVPVTVDVGVARKPPFNLEATLTNISQFVLFYGSELTLWGNPADPSHDPIRGQCLNAEKSVGEPESLGSCPFTGQARPFLTLPRSCQGDLTAGFAATSWAGERAAGTATVEGMSGCANLLFGPDLALRPTNAAAESATGLDVGLQVTDEGLAAPEGTAESDIREVVLTLPEGMSANPSAAEGLGVCTAAQFEAAGLAHPGCPAASKLGTVRATTPLLEEAVEGSLYLAAPEDPATPQAENPFASLLALYIVLRNPRLGIVVTQAGEVVPDPRNGRLISTFSELPQFPLSRVAVRFREGARAPLVTPPLCGTHPVASVLTPWSGTPAEEPPASFAITAGPGGGPCPPGGALPFAPGLEAGSLNNSAGAFSPFLMRLTRADGEQDMTRFDATLPAGVAAKLAGSERCPDAAIAAAKAKTGRQELASPSCPAGSRIGSVRAGAGVGTALTYVPGSLHLAGPLGSAPLSVVAIVPAVAGPFDVGTVVVRQALALDPLSAEVKVDSANSDPIPHILAGIPLKVRDIRVEVDRPRFTLNPTSCEPLATLASIWGGGANPFSPADDSPLARLARYQAASCASLAFAPKLAIMLRGGTRRGAHPALRAVVTPRPGQANFSRAVVTLPRSAFLEQGHIRTICTRVRFAAGAGHGAECPKGSIYGRARAWSPLLDAPAEGPVFLRSSSNKLPDLVVALKGPASAPVDVELSARIDSVRGGIRSTFAAIPDLPVSRFILDMRGGRKGLIVNSRDLCRKPKRNRARARLRGQNGRSHRIKPLVRALRCSKGRKAKRSRHRARARR